ncbi:MAG: ATP-binding protein, partial [Proteobacteria bacterium]|nr:ATP-binding protein [Pseudomonadota bacterium]
TQKLLEKHGMIRLRSDVERKRLAGLDALAKSGAEDGLYTQQSSRRTYEHLAELAEGLLIAGWCVIVDAAFLQRNQRNTFNELAIKCGVSFQILDIQVEPAVLRERVSQRCAEGRDASEADLRVLEYQLATALPLDSDEIAVAINAMPAD